MAELASWPRPQLEEGGGAPFLFYELYGDFTEVPTVVGRWYRTAGIPDGVRCHLVTRASNPELFDLGLSPILARDLDDRVRARVEASSHALVIRGAPAAADTLDYLRDTIGVITAMFDAGAVAMFEAQRFHWWTPAAWREQVFEPACVQPGVHVVILVSEEDTPGLSWVHTRGMRIFGRPDVSVHGVTAAELPAVEELCRRFIGMAAAGAVIPEGMPVRINGLTGPWRCFHAGDVDDPDFNNVHVEVRRM